MRVVLCAVFLVVTASCSMGTTGGGCKYDTAPGTCRLTRVGSQQQNNRDANSTTEFDFVKEGDSMVSDHATLTVVGGQNPGRQCLDAQGYTLNSSHDCTKRTIKDGTCAPTFFDHPDFDPDLCE